jgi:hypothetical protein
MEDDTKKNLLETADMEDTIILQILFGIMIMKAMIQYSKALLLMGLLRLEKMKNPKKN